MEPQLLAGVFNAFAIKKSRKKKRHRFRCALAKLPSLVLEIETHEGQIEQGPYLGVAGCCLLGYIEDLIHYLVHCKFDNTIWIKLVDLPLCWKRFPPPERQREIIAVQRGGVFCPFAIENRLVLVAKFSNQS